MHCKHCGNQIENDSKFCSFCGGKTEPIEQRVEVQQPLNQNVLTSNFTPNSEKTKTEKFTNAFLIIGIIDFTFYFFWEAYWKIVTDLEASTISKLEIILKPIWIINICITIFLCVFFAKKKEHKSILLIIGVLLLGWSIYGQYFKV